MAYSDLVTHRPKGFILIFLVILITGIYAFYQIPKEDLPVVDYPRLTVTAGLPNQSPENVIKYVTSVIEEELAAVRGVLDVSSVTSTGYCRITVELERKADPDFIMFLVNEKISSIKDKLPQEVSGPTVHPYVPREIGEDTFFSLYLSSDILDGYTLTQFAEDDLQRELAEIPGVSGISIYGGMERELSIAYDQAAIEQYNISFYSIVEKVMSMNKKITMGHVRFRDKRLYISFINDMDLQNIGNWDMGNGVRLSQVAQASFRDEEPQTIHKINGKPAVYVLLTKAADANAILVSQAVLKKLESMQRDNPSILCKVADNEGEKVLDGYSTILVKILVSVLAIFLVLFSFMRHVKPSLITMSSIFLSVSFAINYLFFAGESLNKFTLSGIALAFGLLVDNAVVVYENIHKHYYSGKRVKEAIALSFKEMFIPIIASTVTTVCVLLPFVFLQEELKVYYIPFAKTIVVALIASIFISFSLIPIAFSYFHIESKIRKSKSKAIGYYQKYVGFLLRIRWVALALMAFIIGYSLYVFIEDVDKSSFSWGGFEYPPELSCIFYPETNVPDFRLKAAVNQFEGLVEGNEIIEYYRTSISETRGQIIIYFKKDFEGSAEAYALREKLKVYGNRMSQVNVRVWGIGPDFGGGGFMGGTRYQSTVWLQGYNYARLKEEAAKFKTILLSFREISDVKLGEVTTSSVKKAVLKIDSEKLDIYGLSLNDVASKVRSLVSEYTIENTVKLGRDYINFTLAPEEKIGLYELKNLYLAHGVKLTDVADIDLEASTRYIEREDQVYSYPISYDFSSSDQTDKQFKEGLRDNILYPPGFSLKIEDDAYRWWDEETDYNKILILLGFAIILIYMILGALYESYTEPFIILLTLPLAFVGVIWLYKIFKLNFGVHAIMGSMLLAGIVVNNAIIMVNHINHLRREKGVKRAFGIILGASDRIRPILITSLTTIMGLLPIILLKDKSDDSSTADIWKHLSYATVGGLTTSTFFTLTFMPILYFFFSKKTPGEKPYSGTGFLSWVRAVRWRKMPALIWKETKRIPHHVKHLPRYAAYAAKFIGSLKEKFKKRKNRRRSS
ncbi:MAG TPA: efflux RND transporter permease subunit [Firmicutes bacterium]|nr:efflux RND transporter permease subunit [Bacillota bacterium]